MSSFSERAALKRANEDRQPRDDKDTQGEPNPFRPLYQSIPERRLRLVRSNGVLTVKDITSIEPTALDTKDSEAELYVPSACDLPKDQQSFPLEDSRHFEGSLMSKDTGQPVVKRIDSEGSENAGSSQSNNEEALASNNLSLDLWRDSKDEESSIELSRLDMLQNRFQNLEKNKHEKSKQLNPNGSQLQEPYLATTDMPVGSGHEVGSTEDQYFREISELRKRLQLVESERAEFYRNFRDAQEQIFSMQPRRSDITEDEAAQEYGSLCANIENWTHNHLSEVLNLDRKIYAHSEVNIVSGSRLLAMIGMTPGAINAKDFPDTLQYYLRIAIMNFICHEIFQQELYGAGSGPWKLLHTIEISMRGLKPRRDRAMIRAWRSETLAALIASSEYKNFRRQHARELAGHLCGGLEVLLPNASRTQLVSLKNSIFQDLVLPALKLSERFHLSAKLFYQQGRGADKDAVPIAQEIGMYECRNHLANGKLVKSLAHGVECEYLLDICPALYCRNLKVDTLSAPKQLKKAQILVAARRPDMSYNLHGETALGHIFRITEAERVAVSKETENKEPEKKRNFFGF